MTTADSHDDRLTAAPALTIRVLLVDDQPMVGEAIRRVLLPKTDTEFHYCANPQQALAVARDFRPTVILQDLIMPNVSGLDLVRQFRADPATAGIPIVVLSSREDPVVKSDAFGLGANDYLVKLPDPIELVARIRYHSMAYLAQIQRDEAYRALRESQRRLMAAGITLAENEARYHKLADHATDIILHLDPSGIIHYVSPACRRLGYEPDDLVGRSRFDFVHPDDNESMQRGLGLSGRGDPEIAAACWQHRFLAKDGRWVWMESSPSVVRDSQGGVIGVISLVRDITERREAEAAIRESEARYRLLADTATDVISRSDLDGIMLYLSPAVERVTGYGASEFVGRKIVDFVHPDDALRFVAHCVRVAKGKHINGTPVEYRIRHRDGRWIWIEGSPTLVRGEDGRALGFVDVSRDATLRKTLETELRTARREAEAAAAVKGEFLANMSHELRTPLTSVVGFTHLALQQPELTEVSRSHIRKASHAGAALLATVNDILDFSKLESGQLQIHLEPSDAAEICAETLELFSETAAAKGVALGFEATGLPPSLSLDPNRLRQLLLNLIGNAVKFSDSGTVALAVAWRAADQRLIVDVKDQGPGIAPDQQSRLFQRFSQVDGGSTRSHGGAGLGLAICLGLVEAMGGRIGLESELGLGARFFFEIPAARAVESKVEAQLDMPLFRPGVRMLVADDHPFNRDLVRAVLAPFGAEVSEAANGAEAVAVAAVAPFDLILMDLRMPELDGMDAMRAIREGAGPNCDAPILAFSAGVDASTAAARLQAGFDGDLSKPLLPADLIAAVSCHTGGRTAELLEPQDGLKTAGGGVGLVR